MIELIKNLGQENLEVPEQNTLCLDYDQRTKGRLRTTSIGGADVGLFLERGKLLQSGDVLSSKTGELMRVEAADEKLIEAHTEDWSTFARCCYHLGNRHVPLEIAALRLKFRPDHILQEMIEQHGMQTKLISAPFNPEQGAYAHSKHGHSHGHCA